MLAIWSITSSTVEMLSCVTDFFDRDFRVLMIMNSEEERIRIHAPECDICEHFGSLVDYILPHQNAFI